MSNWGSLNPLLSLSLSLSLSVCLSVDLLNQSFSSILKSRTPKITYIYMAADPHLKNNVVPGTPRYRYLSVQKVTYLNKDFFPSKIADLGFRRYS